MLESGLFRKQVEQVKKLNLKKFKPPKFSQPRVDKNVANELSWQEYKEKMRPLAVIDIPNIKTELVVTPKDVPWTFRDINIYIGGENRDVFEISDLDDKEGEAFIDFNTHLAKRLLDDQDISEIHVSIGFNPDDFSSGHHSIKRLHSHIYTIDYDEIEKKSEKLHWESMSKHEKLAFIEPMSQVYFEYLNDLIKNGVIKKLFKKEVENNIGFISMYFDKTIDSAKLFDFIKTLYIEFKKEHNFIENILTNKELAAGTERYAPRSGDDRIYLMQEYLNKNKDIFSPEAKKMLLGLACNLTPALPRKNGISDINSNETLWITKGFAGAFTFSFEKGGDLIRVDFLPRVLSTNTVEKTIFGKERPSRIERGVEGVSEKNHLFMDRYHQRIIELTDEFKNKLGRVDQIGSSAD